MILKKFKEKLNQINEMGDFFPGGLLFIINNNEVISRHDDLEVQMEYQTETLGTYNLSNHDGKYFILNSVNTNCLAPDKCGIPPKTQITPQKKQCNTPSCC